tara:strand:- start:1438 stop:2118 length:681 start_codon:yes stop_codon:yes gene_type:complete
MKKINRLVSVIVIAASTFFISSNVASAGMTSEPEPSGDYDVSIVTVLDNHCYKNGLVFVDIENNNPTHLKMAPESIWVNVQLQIFASDDGAYTEYRPGPTATDSEEVAAGDSVSYGFVAPEGSFFGVVKVYVAESSFERPDLVSIQRMSIFCDDDPGIVDIPEIDFPEIFEDDPEETTEGDPEETTEGDPEETTEGDPEETTEDDPEDVTETEVDDPIEGSPLFTG